MIVRIMIQKGGGGQRLGSALLRRADGLKMEYWWRSSTRPMPRLVPSLLSPRPRGVKPSFCFCFCFCSVPYRVISATVCSIWEDSRISLRSRPPTYPQALHRETQAGLYLLRRVQVTQSTRLLALFNSYLVSSLSASRVILETATKGVPAQEQWLSVRLRLFRAR